MTDPAESLDEVSPVVDPKPVRRLRIITQKMGPAALHNLVDHDPVNDDEPLPERPRTRGECADVPRPCPFVSCSYNLFLDVGQKGRLILQSEGEPDAMDPEWSCALDVADRGPHALEQISDRFNVTREAVRQVEASALKRLANTCTLERPGDVFRGCLPEEE